jgi:hypothetical protein
MSPTAAIVNDSSFAARAGGVGVERGLEESFFSSELTVFGVQEKESKDPVVKANMNNNFRGFVIRFKIFDCLDAENLR